MPATHMKENMLALILPLCPPLHLMQLVSCQVSLLSLSIMVVNLPLYVLVAGSKAVPRLSGGNSIRQIYSCIDKGGVMTTAAFRNPLQSHMLARMRGA